MKEFMNFHMDQLIRSVLKQPWGEIRFYKEYLAQSYHYTFYSCRMLAMSAALSTAAQSQFYKRSVQHIAEENGHDNLAVTDLKRLGGCIEDHPELAVTRALWEPQFTKIQKQPTALLGYVLALELLCVRTFRELHALLANRYGEKCVNFVRVHADDDPDHVEKAFAQIDALSTEERGAVWKNYEQTCRMFALMLEECAFRAEQPGFGLERSRDNQPAV